MIVEVVDAATTSELRRAVLRPYLEPGTPMPGDAPPSLHLAARDAEGALLGACVLFPRDCPALPGRADAWQLRGMATVPAAQGRGVGRAVIAAAIREVRTRGGRLLWCEAREAATGFYRRQGFAGTGALYPHAETGRPHLLMYRDLGATEPSGPPASSSG